MALFMLFGLLWICAWLKFTSQFIVMVSASTYYFNSNANNEGAAEVGIGFTFAYCYHCGSLAAGAFVIAVIQFIRIVFMYLAKQAERASGDNQAIKLVVACGACILKCIEKICDYISQAGFAYMAISGESFCTSAWNGFLLNVKHTLKFSFANLLAKVFIFLGKAAVTVGNVFSCYFIMKNITKDTEEVSSLVGPLLVVCIVTYMTASIFLGLFDTAVLALMTCLAIDMDLHDGTPEYGPPTFHDSIGGISAKTDEHENKGKTHDME
jgi:choline transporter-like protein 2/4/5